MSRGSPSPGRLTPPSRDFERVPPERRAATVRRIVAFFNPYRAQVAVVLAAIITTSLLGIVNPYLLKLLIDNVIVGGQYQDLNLYVGLMIVVPIVSGLIGVGQSYLNNVIGQNVMQDLRNALYAHLQRLPLRFFTATRTGEIQSRLANDVGGVQAVVTDTAASVTSNVAITISTVIAMLLLSWQLTLLSLGITPFFMYLTYRVGKVRREVSGETQKRLAEMTAVTEETLSVSGILLGKTFAAQDRSVSRFRDLNRELARLQIRQAMVGPVVLHDHRHDLLDHAGVRVLARGHDGGQRLAERPDGRRHRRVHDAPEPPVLPARAAAQRPGRDPGVARAVRPDLRVPRPRPRDRRRAGRDRAAARDDAGRRGARGRLVPLPAGAARGPAHRRRRGGRRRSRVESGPRGCRPGVGRRGGVRQRRRAGGRRPAGAWTSPCSRSASTTSRSRRSRASWWRSSDRRAPARRRRPT